MQAAERLRWIALEGDAVDDDTVGGSDAAHAHGKWATRKTQSARPLSEPGSRLHASRSSDRRVRYELNLYRIS